MLQVRPTHVINHPVLPLVCSSALPSTCFALLVASSFSTISPFLLSPVPYLSRALSPSLSSHDHRPSPEAAVVEQVELEVTFVP